MKRNYTAPNIEILELEFEDAVLVSSEPYTNEVCDLSAGSSLFADEWPFNTL